MMRFFLLAAALLSVYAADAAQAAVVAELDLAMIRQQRRQEPTFRALRPELYEM